MSAESKLKFSKDTRMAMISQFLGFMLDAYDMALVLVMAPILVKVFSPPGGSAVMAVYHDRPHLLDNDGCQACRFGDLRTLCR